MATFRITPANSIRVNINGGSAYFPDSIGPDTLIIDPFAYVLNTTIGTGHGVLLANSGAWTVTIKGSVGGGLNGGSGLFLGAGNPGVSTITVTADGEVRGGNAGMVLASPATVKNAGEIIGGNGTNEGHGIELKDSGAHTIINTGTITGLGGGDVFSIDDHTAGTTTLTNSGTLNGHVFLGHGDSTVTNSKLVNGAINLGNGTNKLTNSGTITGAAITGGGVSSGTGVDTIINSGTIVGTLETGSGDDTVTNFIGTKSGTVSSFILMGDGNDKFFGGNNKEELYDGAGSDLVNLGGGNDHYHAKANTGAGPGPVDGTDTVDGGLGVDTYDGSVFEGPNLINIDTVAHNLFPINFDGLTPAGTVRTFPQFGPMIQDNISGFENVIGSNFYDAIYGNAAANFLDGRGNGDNIFGYGGNDTLVGGAGADALAGGAGKDRLFGGLDSLDYFQYFLPSDSGITRATRDVIEDYQDNIDKIDLSFIDANSLVAGHQEFDFLGTHNVAFTGAGGQLRAMWTANGQLLLADINGDKAPDFTIEITDPTHTKVLDTLDFFGVF